MLSLHCQEGQVLLLQEHFPGCKTEVSPGAFPEPSILVIEGFFGSSVTMCSLAGHLQLLLLETAPAAKC